jgi:ADP-ribose pyrophosphatase YjhB (NUDIX family)
LVVQRCDNGRWEPPGGVLEVDEAVADGLQREVREETGLVVEPMALTGVYKNMRRGIVALVFRCRVIGGELTTNEEVCAFRWATRDEVRSFLSEAYAVRVLDALDQAQPPAVRQHDGTHLV